eukprot:m.1524401 g.1524401  ORF g.1524401 m.1524401 type:complete len:58 (+) comp25232_c0_seq56:72-245(+)
MNTSMCSTHVQNSSAQDSEQYCPLHRVFDAKTFKRTMLGLFKRVEGIQGSILCIHIG